MRIDACKARAPDSTGMDKLGSVQHRFLNDVKNDENVIFSEFKFESIFVTGALQGCSWRVQRHSVTKGSHDSSYNTKIEFSKF